MKTYLDIYDLSIFPYALGDLITWNIRSAMAAELAGAEKCHVVVFADKNAPHCCFQDRPDPDQYELYFSEIQAAIYSHPLASSFAYFHDRAELEAHLSTRKKEGFLFPDNYAEYQKIYNNRNNRDQVIAHFIKYVGNQSAINTFFSQKGFVPSVKHVLGCRSDAEQLISLQDEGSIIITIQFRYRGIDQAISDNEVQRNVDCLAWEEFFLQAAEKYPQIKFILLGRIQEKPLRILKLPNIIAPRALGFNLGHEISLLLLSDLYIGSSSGFAQVAFFSDVPYRVTRLDQHACDFYSIPYGSECLPFAKSNQRLLYGNETSEILFSALEEAIKNKKTRPRTSLFSDNKRKLSTFRFFNNGQQLAHENAAITLPTVQRAINLTLASQPAAAFEELRQVSRSLWLDMHRLASDRSGENLHQTIAVFMPNFNDSRFLQKAFAEMAVQSPQPDQTIVVDDCSTDGSRELIAKWESESQYNQAIFLPSNKGVANTFVEALKSVRTDYICSRAVDDTYSHDHLAKITGVLNTYPETGIVCFQSLKFNPVSGERFLGKKLTDSVVHFSAEDAGLALRRDRIWDAGLAWKTDELRKVMDCSWKMRWWQQIHQADVIALRCGFCYIPEPLMEYNMRDQSFSSGGNDLLRHAESFYASAKDFVGNERSDVFQKAVRSGFFGLREYPSSIYGVLNGSWDDCSKPLLLVLYGLLATSDAKANEMGCAHDHPIRQEIQRLVGWVTSYSGKVDGIVDFLLDPLLQISTHLEWRNALVGFFASHYAREGKIKKASTLLKKHLVGEEGTKSVARAFLLISAREDTRHVRDQKWSNTIRVISHDVWLGMEYVRLLVEEGRIDKARKIADSLISIDSKKDVLRELAESIPDYSRSENRCSASNFSIRNSKENERKSACEIKDIQNPPIANANDLKESLSESKVLEFFSPEEVENIQKLVESYESITEDCNAKSELLALREGVASYLLESDISILESLFSGNFGQVFRIILQSTLQKEPLTDSETRSFSQFSSTFEKNSKADFDIRELMVYMLYREACVSHIPKAFDRVPDWFLADYLKYYFCLSGRNFSAGESGLEKDTLISRISEDEHALIISALRRALENSISSKTQTTFEDIKELYRKFLGKQVSPSQQSSTAKSVTIGIVMPNYNHKEYLPDAFLQISLQNESPDQHIVVDDGSTDGSQAVIDRWSKEAPYNKAIYLAKNVGVNAAVAEGIKFLETQYVCCLSVNDCYSSGYLERAYRVLSKHPDAGLACFQWCRKDVKTGHYFPETQMPEIEKYYSPSEAESILRRHLLFDAGVIISASEYRRELNLDWRLRWWGGLHLCDLVALRKGFCHVPDKLITFNSHEHSFSGGTQDLRRHAEAIVASARDFCSEDKSDVYPACVRSGFMGTRLDCFAIQAVLNAPWENGLKPLLLILRGLLEKSEAALKDIGEKFNNKTHVEITETLAFLDVFSGAEDVYSYWNRLRELVLRVTEKTTFFGDVIGFCANQDCNIGNVVQARKLLNKVAHGIYPTRGIMRAFCLVNSKDVSQEKRDHIWKKAIDLMPEDVWFGLEYAKLLVKDGKVKEAIRIAESLCSKDSGKDVYRESSDIIPGFISSNMAAPPRFTQKTTELKTEPDTSKSANTQPNNSREIVCSDGASSPVARSSQPRVLFVSEKLGNSIGDPLSIESQYFLEAFQSLCSTSCEILSIQGEENIDSLLAKRCLDGKPDVVILLYPTIYSRPYKLDTFRILKEAGFPLVFVWGDKDNPTVQSTLDEVAPYSDLNVFVDSGAIASDSRTLFLWPALDSLVFRNPKLQRTIDVYSDSLLKDPDEWRESIQAMTQNNVVFIQGQEDNLSPDDIAWNYQKSKIVLSVSDDSLGNRNAVWNFWKSVTCGAVVFQKDNSTIGTRFTPWEEYVPFSTPSEFSDRLNYYLAHPDELQNIAENAQRKYLEKYTAQAWLASVLEACRLEKPFPNVASGPHATPATDEENLAEDFFSRDEISNIECLIANYQRNPSTHEYQEQVLTLRQCMASFLLECDMSNLKALFANDFGKVYRLVLNSGIQRESLSAEEAKSFSTFIETIQKAPEIEYDFRELLVYMLYCRGTHLRATLGAERIFSWFESDYREYISSSVITVQSTLDNELFQRGNFVACAMNPSECWERYAAMGLMGLTGPAIEGLSRYVGEEVKFYIGATHWMDGNEKAAMEVLEGCRFLGAEKLLSLIQKPQIDVLTQTPIGCSSQYVPDLTLSASKRFRIKNIGPQIGSANTWSPLRAPGNIFDYISGDFDPDFYLCREIEWQALPSNLHELKCPVFGHTEDYDIHLQTVFPLFRSFNRIITCGSYEWRDLSRMQSVPIATFPMAYGLPDDLPDCSMTHRDIDIFLSGTIFHPYHPDKAKLVHGLLSSLDSTLNIRVNSKVLPHGEYFDLLGQSKISLPFVRFDGSMPTRGLESLAMGNALILQKGCALSAYYGESEGVFTCDYWSGELLKTINKVSKNWPDIAPCALRGSQRVREDFLMSNVCTRYLRFLTVMAALSSNSEKPTRSPAEGKRSVICVGWTHDSEFYLDALAFRSEELSKKPGVDWEANEINDLAREVLLFYVAGSNENIRNSFLAWARWPLSAPPFLGDALELLRIGMVRFPRFLALQFNLMRTLYHFSGKECRSEAREMAEHIARSQFTEWDLAVMDDVMPWDFQPEHFNYRAYFDLGVKVIGEGREEDPGFFRLIRACCAHYAAMSGGSLEFARMACADDPEFPLYQIALARSLALLPEGRHESALILDKMAEQDLLPVRAWDDLKAYKLEEELPSDQRAHLQDRINRIQSRIKQ